MGMITNFYRNGSEMKRQNHEDITQEIAKLEFDQKMVQDQLAALEKKSLFKRHPKLKEYERNLKDELEGLMKQKEGFLEKQKNFLELSEWSKTIVKVCEWLELNMDDYCVNTLKLPLTIKVKPVPKLSEEESKTYSKGLSEITYNLNESQDFFQASLDGRLNKYHNIEKQIIEAQIEALQKYPEDNARRIFVEAELRKDLEYVLSNSQENPQSTKRREKMLLAHNEFFKVLTFHKDKLKALGIDDSNLRKYDPKYDHYQE